MAIEGTELAKAYVQIIPSAQGIKGKLKETLGGEASHAGDSAGKIAGNSLVSGIKKVVAAAGIGKAIKDAMSEGADLQQSIGGIETLFKESSDKVINSAYNAYKTAGLSANEYMEAVTGFSASLLQGLSGDTDKAADIADMALTDMADNANKMGTSMESIQNAYQGFAKQNYTMLDNLKLGYGGTKTEMERLLADASKLSGVEYNIDNLSDVYNAIHVIQGELDITGTTAKEAESTFTGSAAAMKSAFKNVLGNLATGEDVKPALLGLMDSASIFVKNNFIPMLGNIFTSLLEVIGTAFQGAIDNIPYVSELIDNVIGNITENAPGMVTAAADLVASFISGIGEQLPELVPKALEMVVTLSDAVIDNIPTIVKAAGELLKGLVKGIIQSLPTLIAEGPRIINEFCDAIYDAIGELVSLGLDLIVSLVTGLWDNRQLILDNAGEIFKAFINVFSLSNMLNLGKNLISNLKNGITNLFPSIKTAGSDILKNLVSGIKNMAMHPVTTVITIISNVKSTFANVNWWSIGENIISGIVNGLKAGIGSIISAAHDAASRALKSAKEALGIHSPSRLFENEVGKMIDLGLAAGIRNNIDVVSSSMKELSASTVGMVDTDFNTYGNKTLYAKSNNDMQMLSLIVKILSMLNEYLPKLANMKVVMDSGMVIGELAPGMDAALGELAVSNGKGI